METWVYVTDRTYCKENKHLLDERKIVERMRERKQYRLKCQLQSHSAANVLKYIIVCTEKLLCAMRDCDIIQYANSVCLFAQHFVALIICMFLCLCLHERA